MCRAPLMKSPRMGGIYPFTFTILSVNTLNLSVHVTLMETHFAKLNITKRELVKLTRAVNSAR